MDAPKMSTADKQSQKGFSHTAIQLLNGHITLLGIELEEAKQFYWRCFIRLAVIVVCCVLFFILFSIGVVAYFWDSYRMTAILGLLGIYLLIIIVSLISLVCLQKRASLFAMTKEELAKDKQVFFDD